jgi:hypothetical protein
MYPPIRVSIKTQLVRNPVSPSPLRRGFLLTPLVVALAWFALSPTPNAFAVDPPPDGGYANANTAEGDSALASLTSGTNNTAIGFEALFSNTTGNDNTATGVNALFSNTTGNFNTANGVDALFSNTTGGNNTATGYQALLENTTGIDNTATGHDALFSNTTGNENTATGDYALQFNTTGFSNTANGGHALYSNTAGAHNTANGLNALFSNKNGSLNTANGVNALRNNTGGTLNTATGLQALNNNTSGNNNTALGALAGQNLTTGSNNIDIGANVLGVAGESNKIRIGTKGTQKQTFIAGIHGVTVAGGVTVIIDNQGHLGAVTSSDRFKDEIKPMDKTSEAILGLEPVTFRYKHELDPDSIPQFGLVAEQVEKVNPELVARDDEGKAYTVRYEAVNAMLLNEFLKEHRNVEEQGATITQMKKQIEALTATVEQVSDQLQLSKRTPQLAAINE